MPNYTIYFSNQSNQRLIAFEMHCKLHGPLTQIKVWYNIWFTPARSREMRCSYCIEIPLIDCISIYYKHLFSIMIL